MAAVKIPRILIAGTHSGVGKTTVSLGLTLALSRAGFQIQSFKVGPDYIDPGYLGRAAGRPCRNLDTWLMPKARLPALLARASEGANAALIEGVMGLYDGRGAIGEEGSTAEIAKQLECPVLLVLDVSAVSRSAAAMVKGFQQMDRAVQIAGCVVNRVGSVGHYRLVKEGIERLTGVPVVGWLAQDARLKMPERHLGLVPWQEQRDWKKILGLLQRQARASFDLPAIVRIMERASPVRPESVEGRTVRASTKLSMNGKIPIAVARDEAFHFYYPENLELLEAHGAEIVPFSLLKDQRLPTGIGGLYLGGGFPEAFARDLAGNRSMRKEIHRAVRADLPTYAECGGLMVLSRSLRTLDGRSHPMVGVIPADVRMTDRLQNFGYQEVKARKSNVLARAGEQARGHEFHHSALRAVPSARWSAYQVQARRGGESRLEGYAKGSLLASYIHLHFGSQPRWAERFVQAARKWFIASMTVSILWTQGAWGAEPDEETRLEEVIVTANKAETPAKEVTRSVSVLSGDKLPIVEGAFISQVFSNVPETLVRRSGSIGRTTTVVVRGATASQVHVTIDGVHVASPTTGSFDFNHFAPDNLERIEVLRGPSGTLYGSDAMGGVINLITRRGEGPFTGSYTQEFTTLIESFREAAQFQGSKGPLHLSGSASRIDAEGLSENDAYENTNLSTRVGIDLPNGGTLDFSLRHLFAIIGLDDGAFRPDPNRVDRDRQTIGSAQWEMPVTPWWTPAIKTTAQIGNLIDSDPSNGGTDANALTKLDTERYGIEWRNRLTPVDWDTLTVGFEYEDREADRRTGGANANFSKTLTTAAAFMQNQWNPWEPLTVVAGARFFRESAFGSGEVFDASAAYFVEPWNMKFRGGWGQGFRPPTINELFFPNFGNPNLIPEKSKSHEFGAEQVLWDNRFSWSGTLFRTDYEDLIQFIRVSSTQTQPQNFGHARIDGAELELEFKPTQAFKLKGSFTHLDHSERPSGEELLRTPSHTATFSMNWVPGGKWETQFEGLLVSSREESTGTNSRNKTEGYLVFNAFAQYRWNEWAKSFLQIGSLFNRNYQEVLGFPAEGTMVSIGVKVER